MKVMQVVGARPNFMKVAPVMSALSQREGCRQILVHTGQHYDAAMSDVFFQQLNIPQPDYNLGVGSASHAQQTAEIMVRLEKVILETKPDVVLVYGDVNSTVAAALVCAKLNVQIGHVEAGLRSFDRTMPEEINRMVTDRLADYLFTPSRDGDENLLREGTAAEKIHFVGNVMIDTLVRLLPRTDGLNVLETMGIAAEKYALVTLHRPSNVDSPEELHKIIGALNDIAKKIPVIFPVHPRTRQMMGDLQIGPALQIVEPIGYLEFLSLQRKATVVITDSGGIQEESTFLGIPCLTVRENTERPVTVELGSNILVGRDMVRLRAEVDLILSGRGKSGGIPPLWDGHTGSRIADILF
jgi:UDP-N-acetylglucosamine 2-epimerase (non-hydrolysing)